jgi:hypothetical protein
MAMEWMESVRWKVAALQEQPLMPTMSTQLAMKALVVDRTATGPLRDLALAGWQE